MYSKDGDIIDMFVELFKSVDFIGAL